MRINVADIKLEAGSHKSVDLTVQLASAELEGQEIRFEEPFTGQAEIWNTGDRLLVKAELSGEVKLVCSRCLGLYIEPIELTFEEEFVEAAVGEVRSEEETVDESGRTVSVYSGDELDLSDSLRENVLLELPMKPLCDEDCQGLCPTCGANRNDGTCRCPADDEVVDPRLAVLKDLLQKPDSNS